MSNTFPIVLAHGITRLDILRVLVLRKLGLPETGVDDQLHYFRGIRSHLTNNGFEVHPTNVDFAGSVNLRSQQLSEQINALLSGRTGEKVHIIAHSMGGLDARHMLVDIPGMADKVASVTTIGTPHLGTTLADVVNDPLAQLFIGGLSAIINLQGFNDLTPVACEAFNRRAERAEADNTVVYQACAMSEERNRVFLPFQLSWLILHDKEGANDGLVSVTSQLWQGELTRSDGSKKTVRQIQLPVPGDHLNEMGWFDPQELVFSFRRDDNRKQVEDYENKLKGMYLNIARGLHQLP